MSLLGKLHYSNLSYKKIRKLFMIEKHRDNKRMVVLEDNGLSLDLTGHGRKHFSIRSIE